MYIPSLLIALFYLRPNDLHFVHWSILSICLDQTHSLNHSHATLHATEDSMFAIQPWCWRKGNEELTAIRVGTTVRHAENTGTSVFQVVADFVFEFLAVDRASSSTGAGGITGLDHEIGDDAVEDDIVVVAALCEGREVFAGLVIMA